MNNLPPPTTISQLLVFQNNIQFLSSAEEIKKFMTSSQRNFHRNLKRINKVLPDNVLPMWVPVQTGVSSVQVINLN